MSHLMDLLKRKITDHTACFYNTRKKLKRQHLNRSIGLIIALV